MEMREKNNKPDNVPYIVFEAEIARQERHIKRLWIALIAAVVAIVLVVGGFLLYLNQYDFASYEQDGQGVNIIGDGNGVDYNGPTAESPDTQETVGNYGNRCSKKEKIVQALCLGFFVGRNHVPKKT